MKLNRTIPLVGILIALIFFFVYQYWLNDERFDSESLAEVQKAEIIKGISQTEVGNKISITAFKLEYEYFINNSKYVNNQYISNGVSLSFDNKSFLKNLKRGDKIKIKYDSKEPLKSKIILK